MDSSFESIFIALATIIVTIIGFNNKNNPIFIKILTAILVILLPIIIILSIITHIADKKRKKIVNEIAVEGAKDFYKEKYGETLNIKSIKTYFYLAELYLDDDKKKFITVYVNEDYKISGIYDNIQDDEINKDLQELMSKSLEKFDVKVLSELTLNKKSNRVIYKGDIVEYLTKNNLRINMDILKLFKDKDFSCKDFLIEVENTLKAMNLNNYFLDVMFLNEKLPEGMEKEDLDQSNFGLFVLSDELGLPYEEGEGDNYMYTYIKE